MVKLPRGLSEYAFESLYKRSISAGARLQFAEGVDGSIVVWPLREALDVDLSRLSVSPNVGPLS
jgi:hypothetical protein